MNLIQATEQLAKAKGRSEHVMSIFMDIRGFSRFSRENESPNIAIYVKKLFLKVLTDFFPEATYAKPTGDGLLIIYPYDEETLSPVANKVVAACLGCVEQFPSLCANDPMLNFALPDKVGFGVSRGLACCLYQGEVIIDYSGHLLNLAARLNAVARPSGVVIDGSFAAAGLEKSIAQQFLNDSIFLKGVADDRPVDVLYQAKRVEIPENYRKPLSVVNWETETVDFLRKDITKMSWWAHYLKRPADQVKGAKVTLQYPMARSKNGYHHLVQLTKFIYVSEPSPRISVDMTEVEGHLKLSKVTASSKLQLKIAYVPASP